MRSALAALAAIAGVGALALSAAGGDVRGSDRAGDVRAAGLSAKERAALDIRSVRVTGEEGLGAFVVVKLGGNLEQAIGRGHLKNAVVGIVLHPKPGRG